MASLFAAHPDTEPASRGSGLPRFTLVISPTVNGGWHEAALLRESGNPDYYLRSIAVAWPFVIARPAPSHRQSDVPFRPEQLSPTRSTPTHKLVVNWGWRRLDPNTEQLSFFVRSRARRLLWPTRKLRLRLRLKAQAPPRRRVTLRVSSKPVNWRDRPAVKFLPEGSSSPARG